MGGIEAETRKEGVKYVEGRSEMEGRRSGGEEGEEGKKERKEEGHSFTPTFSSCLACSTNISALSSTSCLSPS